MKNLFNRSEADRVIERINNLTPDTQAKWGKMNVSQMLAHLNVAYDMTFTGKYPRPSAFQRFFLKLFVKNTVVGPKPYAKNGRTAPQFIINDEKDFKSEKQKLIDYINKVQEMGTSQFEGKSSHSFGPLTADEWNVMFSKHMDHHLTQFGV